jgi:hypothetical protein
MVLSRDGSCWSGMLCQALLLRLSDNAQHGPVYEYIYINIEIL